MGQHLVGRPGRTSFPPLKACTDVALSRFRHEPIATAPRDGRTIEVFLAREGVWTPARWSGDGWVRSDDPERHPLHKITHWRGSLSWSALSESASEPAQPVPGDRPDATN